MFRRLLPLLCALLSLCVVAVLTPATLTARLACGFLTACLALWHVSVSARRHGSGRCLWPSKRGPPQRIFDVLVVGSGLFALSILLSTGQQALGQAQVIPRYQDLRELPVIDARRYGVRADGTTDDKAAMDAAWNAARALTKGGIVEVPKGTIYLATKWRPTAPGTGKAVWLKGAGVGLTTFRFDTTVANNSYVLSFNGTNASSRYIGRVRLSDFSVDSATWGLDGVNRTNSGTVQGVTSTTMTLASTASPDNTNAYYNGMALYIVADSGNARAVGQQLNIATANYNGTTKVLSNITWAAGRQPTAAARYGILMDGVDSDDQKTRGVGRILFNFCDNIVIDNISGNGGHGFVDFRGTNNVFVSNFYASNVAENAFNCLSGVNSVTDPWPRNYTVTNVILDGVGEGFDLAVDYATFSNIYARGVGEDDECADFNSSHYVTLTNAVIIGFNHAINFHGTTDSTDHEVSPHHITISNVVATEFYGGGVSMLFAAPDGTVQSATHGDTHHITFTNCSFKSSITGAKGLELSWVGGSYPTYVDDIKVLQCDVDVSGDALVAHMNRRLTVRDCQLYSSAGRGMVASNSTYNSQDVQLLNCRIKGAATSTTTGGGIEIQNSIRPVIKGCKIDSVITQGYAINLNNCRAAQVIENEVFGSQHHGISVAWTSSALQDADADLKTVVRGNRVYDFGSFTTSRFGITVTMSAGTASYLQRQNTAQGAGDSTHLTLDTGASAVDDFYNTMYVSILSDATTPSAAGQTRQISDYTGSSKEAVVSAWTVNPSSAAVYAVHTVPSLSGVEVSNNYVTYASATSSQTGINIGIAVPTVLTVTGNTATEQFTNTANRLKYTTCFLMPGSITTGNNITRDFVGTSIQGRYEAARGRYILDGWFINNLADSVASPTEMTRTTSTSAELAATGWIATRAGSIVGLGLHTSATNTTGNITARVYKNGVATGVWTQIGTSSANSFTAFGPGIATFTFGDAITILYTSGNVTPDTPDIRAEIEVIE